MLNNKLFEFKNNSFYLAGRQLRLNLKYVIEDFLEVRSGMRHDYVEFIDGEDFDDELDVLKKIFIPDVDGLTFKECIEKVAAFEKDLQYVDKRFTLDNFAIFEGEGGVCIDISIPHFLPKLCVCMIYTIISEEGVDSWLNGDSLAEVRVDLEELRSDYNQTEAWLNGCGDLGFRDSKLVPIKQKIQELEALIACGEYGRGDLMMSVCETLTDLGLWELFTELDHSLKGTTVESFRS